MSAHPYFAQPRPHVLAHRGGAHRWPENTALAFGQAWAVGASHLETDLRLTEDGAIVCIHDPRVDRTTNGRGRVAQMSLAELQSLDAAYRFSPDGGHHFPHRGRGVVVPTLEEAMAVDPNARFNVEIKPGEAAMIEQLAGLIEKHRWNARILVASADERIIRRFREVTRGTVVTSAGAREVFGFWLDARTGRHRGARYPFQALQVPPTHGPLTVVDRTFIEAAHAHGVEVHVWTINQAHTMRGLLALGADGLVTDVPDRMLEALGRLEPGTAHLVPNW